MLNLLVFVSQRTNRWEYIQVSGTLMIGLQEVVWWKLIGPKHPLQLTTAISKLLKSPLSLPLPSLILHCRATSLMLMVEQDWDGFRSISWYIITAKIFSDFHKVFLLSVEHIIAILFYNSSVKCIWLSLF